MIEIIAPRSGVAFQLKRGDRLKVIDPEGQQVADLVAFNRLDTGESISSGRSIDYASKLLFGAGDSIYSNRSNVLLDIVEDTVGRHDFLLSPCSAEMFRIIYGDDAPHRGCFGNLAAVLAPHGIHPDSIPTAFNVFMNVRVDGESGVVSVQPPLSRAGDFTVFEARMDLLIGLTACSAGQSNNFTYKPIHYEVMRDD
ncbi:MAG: urea carboxylase-associated family protein [Dokdonella sp.]